jgi:putative peptidoglycan lipid II flippase
VSLVFNVTSIVMSSVLNAKEKFLPAQLTGFPLSLTCIIAAIFFSADYGIVAQAWAVFAAGILQVVVQLPFFFGWFKYTPNFNVRDERFKQLMILAGPALLSMAVSELNHMIDHALASSLVDGSMTALNYGYRLITFITGILVVPITTIVFSKFSKMAAEGDKDSMVATIRRCIEVLALMLVPVIAVCAVMNKDVIRFAYGSGAFDERSVMMTSGAFLFYVIGVLSFGLRDLFNRAFHTMKDTKTPFRGACVVVATNIVLNVVLRYLMGANGLALATTLAGATGMVMMLIMLRKRLGNMGLKRTLVDFAKVLIGGVVCALVCFGMDRLLPVAAGRIQVFFRLAAVSIVSIGCYGIIELVLRERQLNAFAGSFIRKFTHRKG